MRIMNVPIPFLRPGMVVYEDLYNSSKLLILPKDTVLNEIHIDKIKLNDIDKVKIKIYEEGEASPEKEVKITSIYNEESLKQFRQKYSDTVDEITSVIKEIGRGDFVNLKEINSISKRLIKEFNTLSDVINYLHFVRPMDDYTYSHSLNVSLMSIIIAKWLDFNEQDIDEIATAGILHDIGKTRISQALLSKPGKLSEEEFAEIKKHAFYGYVIIEKEKDVSNNIKNSILMHHEKIDGSGYPMGARDEDIPLFAKIVAVADIYDAMTSDRAYRTKMCPFEVIKNFEMQTFGKLDTRVLTIFLKNIANSYIGDFAELNTGEIVEIVFINPNRVWQPIVKSGSEYIDLSQKDGRVFIKEII